MHLKGKGLQGEDYLLRQAHVTCLNQLYERLTMQQGFIKYRNLDLLKQAIAPVTMSIRKVMLTSFATESVCSILRIDVTRTEEDL